jgi:hypothetical protein
MIRCTGIEGSINRREKSSRQKGPEQMKVMIYGFYTDKETKEALKKAAKETGRPKAHILNEGLKKELEAIEKGKK